MGPLGLVVTDIRRGLWSNRLRSVSSSLLGEAIAKAGKETENHLLGLQEKEEKEPHSSREWKKGSEV